MTGIQAITEAIALPLRLEPTERQDSTSDAESLMLGLFLDFLTRQALSSEGGPLIYCEAMAAEDDDLLAGVSVDAGDGATAE